MKTKTATDKPKAKKRPNKQHLVHGESLIRLGKRLQEQSEIVAGDLAPGHVRRATVLTLDIIAAECIAEGHHTRALR